MGVSAAHVGSPATAWASDRERPIVSIWLCSSSGFSSSRTPNRTSIRLNRTSNLSLCVNSWCWSINHRARRIRPLPSRWYDALPTTGLSTKSPCRSNCSSASVRTDTHSLRHRSSTRHCLEAGAHCEPHVRTRPSAGVQGEFERMISTHRQTTPCGLPLGAEDPVSPIGPECSRRSGERFGTTRCQ